MKSFYEWFTRRWERKPDPVLLESFRVTFQSEHGRRVLQHLMDKVYCTFYEGTDPIAAAAHNGRRSLVHEILENIDIAEHPDKYQTSVQTEEARHGIPG